VPKRIISGVVVSTKMHKTLVVKVETKFRHPTYKKIVRLYKKYYAHNEDQSIKLGDAVSLIESKPISKTKRWLVSPNIVKKPSLQSN